MNREMDMSLLDDPLLNKDFLQPLNDQNTNIELKWQEDRLGFERATSKGDKGWEWTTPIHHIL